MNFLAHLYLSGDDPELLVGNLLGDFVKGRLSGNFPAGIERGIVLHRRIDSFSSRSRHFIRSKRRLDATFGHFRGVLVDLFYDHFLAANWDAYTDVPFRRFLSDAHQIAEEYAEVFPERLRLALPVIFAELLPSYREIEGIARALQRMSIRITRPNRLGEGANELRRHYDGLHDDFREFIPELQGFVNGKA